MFIGFNHLYCNHATMYIVTLPYTYIHSWVDDSAVMSYIIMNISFLIIHRPYLIHKFTGFFTYLFQSLLRPHVHNKVWNGYCIMMSFSTSFDVTSMRTRNVCKSRREEKMMDWWSSYTHSLHRSHASGQINTLFFFNQMHPRTFSSWFITKSNWTPPFRVHLDFCVFI